MNNFKEKVKTNKEHLKKSYRALKDKIDPKIGSKLHLIFKTSLSVVFFLLIPILFTTLSTLSGNGKIAYEAYEAVQWTTFSFVLIFFVLLFFFREYPRKLEIANEAEIVSEQLDEKSDAKDDISKKQTQEIVLLEEEIELNQIKND